MPSAAASAASAAAMASVTSFPCYQYDSMSGAWVPCAIGPGGTGAGTSAGAGAAASSASGAGDELNVITYNVLFEFYEADKIFTSERRRALFRLLGASGADIIGLQEVSPSFVEQLLLEDWVRARYYVSDTVHTKTFLGDRSGQLVLSKHVMRTVRSTKLVHGSLVSCVLSDIGVVFACCHLRSGPEFGWMRLKQLASISAELNALSKAERGCTAMLAGDFNMAPGDAENDKIDASLVDVWLELDATATGFTFDKSRNALARALYPVETVPSMRLDRVLYRGDRWLPVQVALLGTEPITPDGSLFISDHFGLSVRWGASERLVPAACASHTFVVPSGDAGARRSAIESFFTQHTRFLHLSLDAKTPSVRAEAEPGRPLAAQLIQLLCVLCTKLSSQLTRHGTAGGEVHVLGTGLSEGPSKPVSFFVGIRGDEAGALDFAPPVRALRASLKAASEEAEAAVSLAPPIKKHKKLPKLVLSEFPRLAALDTDSSSRLKRKREDDALDGEPQAKRAAGVAAAAAAASGAAASGTAAAVPAAPADE